MMTIDDGMTRHEKLAPNPEAKNTAKQIRALFYNAHEAAIENQWLEVIDICESIKVLADHCQQIEESY